MTELHRVVREVQERLPQARGVRHDFPSLSWCRHLADANAAALGHWSDARDALADDPVRIGRLQRQRRLARLDHRELEQLVHELGEVIGLSFDLRREVTHGPEVVHRAGGKRLGQQLDRTQRRAELVPDVCHEVAPHPLDPSQRGDVVHREHQPAIRQR
jgi:hypothetical protein